MVAQGVLATMGTQGTHGSPGGSWATMGTQGTHGSLRELGYHGYRHGSWATMTHGSLGGLCGRGILLYVIYIRGTESLSCTKVRGIINCV